MIRDARFTVAVSRNRPPSRPGFQKTAGPARHLAGLVYCCNPPPYTQPGLPDPAGTDKQPPQTFETPSACFGLVRAKKGVIQWGEVVLLLCQIGLQVFGRLIIIEDLLKWMVSVT